MALKMAIVIGLFIWMGMYFDEKSEKETPLYTLLFSLAGVGAAVYIVIRDTRETK